MRTASSSREVNYDNDNESKLTLAGTIAGKGVDLEALPVPNLKVKRVDNYYSRWSKSWKYRVSLAFQRQCIKC